MVIGLTLVTLVKNCIVPRILTLGLWPSFNVTPDDAKSLSLLVQNRFAVSSGTCYSPFPYFSVYRIHVSNSLNTIMSPPSSTELIHAYRHLFRGLLHAVQYSKPARFTARDQLRDAFRRQDPSTFNKDRVERTVQFLGLAAREAGLEHKLVKNLLYTSWCRRRAYLW